MNEGEPFAALLDKVRAGDEAACSALAAQFAPEIRRVVRIRLREPLLRSTVDTSDVCQSVLLHFFVGARLGKYDLQDSTDLVRLLVTMARHRLLNYARNARVRRIEPQPASGETVAYLEQRPDNAESPSARISSEELVARARELLDDDERRLADYRRAEVSWDEIARLTGSTPEAVRKRLARAVDRVLDRLNLKTEFS